MVAEDRVAVQHEDECLAEWQTMSLKEKLVRFYAVHAPAKVKDVTIEYVVVLTVFLLQLAGVDELSRRYDNKTRELNLSLRELYGEDLLNPPRGQE